MRFGLMSNIGKPTPTVGERPAASHQFTTDIEFADVADRQDTTVTVPSLLDTAHLLPADYGSENCRYP